MDTFLTIASRREVRDYLPEAIPQAIVQRIVDAGRVTGSAKNRQPWRLLVIRDRNTLDALSRVVTRPTNLNGAPLAIGVLLTDGGNAFDAGRAAQSMMLAAWNEGVGSCPNTIKDPDRFQRLTGNSEEKPATLLTFGYPAKKVSPEKRGAGEWLELADRKPHAEIVREVGG